MSPPEPPKPPELPSTKSSFRDSVNDSIGRAIEEDEDFIITVDPSIPVLGKGLFNFSIPHEILNQLPLKWRRMWPRLDIPYILEHCLLTEDEEEIIEEEKTIEKKVEKESHNILDVVAMAKKNEKIVDVTKIKDPIERESLKPVNLNIMMNVKNLKTDYANQKEEIKKTNDKKFEAKEIHLADMRKDLDELGYFTPKTEKWNEKKDYDE